MIMKKLLLFGGLMIPVLLFSQGGAAAWFIPPPSAPAPSWPWGEGDPTAWFVANDVDGDGDSTNNSGNYTTWVDLSGNGYDATALSGDEPTYVTWNNGYGALDFDGSNDYMTTGVMALMDNADEQTQFVVWDQDGTAGSQYICVTDYSENNNMTMFYMSSATNIRFLARNTAGSGKFSDYTVTSGAWGYASGQWNASDEVLVRGNGSDGSGPATVADATPTNHENFTIGAFTGGNGKFNGKIAEVILFNGSITTTIRNAIETYLSNKYTP